MVIYRGDGWVGRGVNGHPARVQKPLEGNAFQTWRCDAETEIVSDLFVATAVMEGMWVRLMLESQCSVMWGSILGRMNANGRKKRMKRRRMK